MVQREYQAGFTMHPLRLIAYFAAGCACGLLLQSSAAPAKPAPGGNMVAFLQLAGEAPTSDWAVEGGSVLIQMESCDDCEEGWVWDVALDVILQPDTYVGFPYQSLRWELAP